MLARRRRVEYSCALRARFIGERWSDMREAISAALKEAVKARDTRRINTLRLINAAIKDRDIEARGQGRDNIGEDDILALLQKMVKQRQESAAIYQKAGREDLAEQEREEIEIIEDFLPQPLSDEEVTAEIDQAIAGTGASGLRDMGKVVSALKQKFPGRIDFAKASKVVKQKLGE